MNGALTRIKQLALRPLWAEGALYRARRRCRMLIATPFAALAGLTWGALSAPGIAVGSPVLWGAIGAFAFPFFLYLEQRLVPPIVELARRRGLGSGVAAALAWEAFVVGGMIYLLTRVLGVPVAPATGTAVGVGAFYAFFMEYVFCGAAASDFATVISGAQGGAATRYEDHSRAEALSRRGDHRAAAEAYRQALERRPSDGAGYVGLARVLGRMGDHEEALAALRSGLLRATLPADREAFLVRQIHELCALRLGDASLAEGDLRRYLERGADGPHAEWAERALADVEERLSTPGERRLPAGDRPAGDRERPADRRTGPAGAGESPGGDEEARAGGEENPAGDEEDPAGAR